MGFWPLRKFKLKASQNRWKKQKNKEWLSFNGIKGNTGVFEIKTQNYKQFEENEKSKELKKAYLNTKVKQQEVKTDIKLENNINILIKKLLLKNHRKVSKLHLIITILSKL